MTIENEAFIDLEVALHTRFNTLWNLLWRDTQKELTKLANEGKWHEASKIAQNIDLKPLVDEVRPLAASFSEASLFLGASRIDLPTNASFYGQPDERLIQNGVDQWAVVLERNATIAIQTQAELTLADMERKFADQALSRIVKAEPDLAKVGKAGTQFSRAAASLMISRMSTAGFMIEATARGRKFYQVNEVMDGATCPICSEMHLKKFPVPDGMAQSAAIMNATDPESLKSIAPFPSQSAGNVKAIQNMGSGQLVGAGMHIPPYHPNCRGITTTVVEGQGNSLALGAGSIAPGRGLVTTEALTEEQLTARMFGDFDELDSVLAIALGVGAGADYGDNE